MPTKAGKVGIGIVGSKFAGELHATAYSRCADAEIVAACSNRPDELEEFTTRFGINKSYSDYHEMMKDPEIDIVSICVPNFLHHAVAMAACEAGKHVVCEKPLATTMEHAREMVEAFDKKGLKLMYAEDWNFAPALVRAKEIVDEGAIGRILYIRAKESHNGSHSPFAQTLDYCGGGALLHLGCHPASFVRYITGQEVVEVVASITEGFEKNLVHHGLEGEDFGVALLTLADGTRAVIEGNYVTQGGMDDCVEIYGTEGVVKVDLTFGSPLSVYSSRGYSYVLEKADLSTGWTKPAIDEFYSLGYETELAAFVRCVKEDLPVPEGARGIDGLATLAIVKAAYQSAAEGRPVDPRELW
ncbi:MAG: Gfo/Idh/MocA family oxidoreductase [Firmicutes bacterium]|jgi:predicted dehydrogenase|nr:Gfo/Idh/MocA family oxidoreductase [Bacillota bacterium]